MSNEINDMKFINELERNYSLEFHIRFDSSYANDLVFELLQISCITVLILLQSHTSNDLAFSFNSSPVLINSVVISIRTSFY
jgi:hypothetical protein